MTRITFVCWGNICRSPMAETVARATDPGTIENLVFASAGISNEEAGNSMDLRARRILKEHGYPVLPHRAHRITVAEIVHSDMVLAAEPSHIARMERLAPNYRGFHLINDFNPELPKGTSLPDPWYGSQGMFSDTLAAIEAAMPGIFEAVQTGSKPHQRYA